MMESYGLKMHDQADHQQKHEILDGFEKIDEHNARKK